MMLAVSERDATWREAVRDALAADPPHGHHVAHADLGYGFGAWSPEFLQFAGRAGWISATWPKDVGGGGEPPSVRFAILQELAYGRAPAEALFYSLAVAHCIYTHGNRELQDELLGPIASGEITFAESFSEPGAGSDLFALSTRATDTGVHFQLDGQKIWTSNGAFADFALVAARTGGDAGSHRGISMFVVDLRDTGVERRPIEDITGEPSFSEIFFDGVVVPHHRLVGTVDGGLPVLLDALEWDRLWARCVKAPFLRRELEDLITQLQLTGTARDWQDESVRHEVGKLAVRIDVCDAMFEHAVLEIEAGNATDTAAISWAKIFADDLGQRFYRTASDLLGLAAAGTTEMGQFSGLERFGHLSLAAHGLILAGGTPEIQRATIASRGLGLPKL